MGNRDFALDLLFFHRGLNCLVAIELKVGEFEPEFLGKLDFYLDALDRDVRKPHEQPSICVLLCASKNDEVVECALSRSLSPAHLLQGSFVMTPVYAVDCGGIPHEICSSLSAISCEHNIIAGGCFMGAA